MKFLAIFLFAAAVQVSARGYAQNLTLSEKNVPLKAVFKEIERQSGYQFFYKERTLDGAGEVTISVKGASLEQVLKICLENQNLNYKIVDKIIVIQSASIQQSSPLSSIRGTVKNEDGAPLEGASIAIPQLKLVVAADKNGAFFLPNLPVGRVSIEISFVGYQTMKKSEVLRDGITLSIGAILQRVNNTVNEVVVMGYDKKRPAEITGAVQTLSGDAIRSGVTSSDVTDMLQGRTPGLYITNQYDGDPTNSGGSMLVRGIGSISNIGSFAAFVQPSDILSPLLVVDGDIMPSQLNLKDVIDPSDIESITILKDASSTAIYGSRAAAGVIVVTTRRGNAGGGMHVNFDLKYGLNTPNRGNIHLLSGQQLYNYQKIYYTEAWSANSAFYMAEYGVTDLDGFLAMMLPSLQQVQDSSFDYEKYGFNNAHTQQANVSVSGGNEMTKYYLNVGYYNEQGTGIDNGLARKTFRMNVDSKLGKRFSVSANINGIFDDGTQDNSGYGNNNNVIYQPPWVWPYNADGSPKQTLNYKLSGFNQTAGNFLYDKQYNFITIRNQQLYGSLKINYNITDWLTASSTNSFNVGYYANKNYIDARTYPGSVYGANGALTLTNSYYNSILSSNVLTYHQHWQKHSLQVLAGQEYGTNYNDQTVINAIGLPAGYSTLSLAQTLGTYGNYETGIFPDNVGETETNGILFSLFGELSYNYNSKYFLNSSIRTDGSTNFGPNERYGTFYSVGGGWLLSSEDFLKNSKTVNMLKLRANYGTSGSQNGNNFLTQTLYNAGLTYSSQPAAVIVSLANPDIHWETTRTLGIGADYSLFRNRVFGNVDYYDRRSMNLIQMAPLTSVAGFPSQYKNTGEVQNKGWEFMVGTKNIDSKSFSWTTSFNISFNKNRLVQVNGDSLLTGGAFDYYLYPGDDVNELRAVKQVGVDPETGAALFQELLFGPDGKVNGTQNVRSIDSVLSLNDPRQLQKMGSMQPRFFGGVTNTFRYKNFSLSALIYFQVGNEVLNVDKYQNQMATIPYFNQVAYIKGQTLWTTPGQKNATEPSLYTQANTDWMNFYNSHFYENASYARLRNVRLSYELPGTWLSKLKASHAEVYISGDNLLTVTHSGFLGSDPAGVPASGGYNNLAMSVGFATGAPRKYLLGLNVTF